MRKQKKFTQQKKFMPRAVRPKEEQAKERERMAEAPKPLALGPKYYKFSN